MATNFKQAGEVIAWTNGTGTTATVGVPVAVGFYGMGIPLVTIANGATGSVQMEGVFALPKTTGAIAQGGPVYWDATNGYCVNAAAVGVWFVGFAALAAGSSATTVEVALEEFDCEGHRLLNLAATGNQTLGVGDFTSGLLTLIVPNTAAKTVNLPPLANVPIGAAFEIKKTDATAQAITLDGNAAETIGGGATFATIDALNDTARFVNTGATWQLLTSAIA